MIQYAEMAKAAMPRARDGVRPRARITRAMMDSYQRAKQEADQQQQQQLNAIAPSVLQRMRRFKAAQ
jgi:hypothetical protein